MSFQHFLLNWSQNFLKLTTKHNKKVVKIMFAKIIQTLRKKNAILWKPYSQMLIILIR